MGSESKSDVGEKVERITEKSSEDGSQDGSRNSNIVRSQSMNVQALVQSALDNRQQDDDSSSTLSIDSFSDRSDLNPEQIERMLMRAYAQRQLNWESLSFWDKLSLFKKWYIVALAGDLCIIFGSIFFVASDLY
jgi:hypothetical protein